VRATGLLASAELQGPATLPALNAAHSGPPVFADRFEQRRVGPESASTERGRCSDALYPRKTAVALRDGIIEALCALAPTAFPGNTDGQPVGVIHVNAPTGPSTYVVSEDTTRPGDYATFHPFETAEKQ
jgi:hypothetical protein